MYKIFLLIIAFSNILLAQSIADISNLANQELEKIKSDLKNSPTEIEEAQIEEIDQVSDEMILNAKKDEEDTVISKYFGLDYFNKQVTFFDNLPTPSNYMLGPGDEIIISMWGETNSRGKYIINKEGLIYYPDIGFINLSNKTLEQAELFLIEKLSDIYSTLINKDNPTTLMLELGSLKSINVYFSGQINSPGVNLIHPFSDIFSAIIQAGGIAENGSLRNIELIRNGEIVKRVDFYSFFMDGKNNFSNTKILDGDVIHIPTYLNRIEITGEVNQPNIYELLPGETLSEIITYASGFTSNASSTIILNKIIPVEERLSDDNARTKIALNFKNSQSKALNNGDSIQVLPITNVDLNVEVFGRVKSPGVYPANNSSLKYILDIAGGFDDPIYRQTIREEEIIILRKDATQFYGIEIKTSYNEADKLQLLPNDKIFVYENINYRNSFTYRIEGEVLKPGTYALKDGITLSDAIELAEGLTGLSSFENIVVYQEFTEINEEDEQIVKSKRVGNADSDFLVGANTLIVALPYENVINVEGNVYNPGLVSYSSGLTLHMAIEQAGGYKPYSMKKRTYVKRANGKIKQANLFRGRAIRIYPGDTVVVPVDPNPSDFEVTSFIADISTTLANIAAILLIVDNQN